MQIDLENQSLVGTVLVIDAIATELLGDYLKTLPADQRQAACDRISAMVAANGKQIVDLAPKPLLSNATKIQAAAARISKQVIGDALAAIGSQAAQK
jgi:stage III sporulation protein SpoIIIAA